MRWHARLHHGQQLRQGMERTKRRIESRRKSLRLRKSSQFAKSVLAKAIANTMQGTNLRETEQDLTGRQLRIFHLLLPVRNAVT
jgi:type II secretory pathway component PulL